MYSEEDKQRDTVIVYSKMAVGLAKVYAPAIGFTAAGIGLMVLSRNILRSRNAALAAALATTTTSFKEYRKRVVERSTGPILIRCSVIICAWKRSKLKR